MNSATLPVVPCPVNQRTRALKALHEGLPEELQEGLVRALDSIRSHGESALDGLLVAPDGEGLAVVWAQRLPGRTASVWPPPVDCPASQVLLLEAGKFLDKQEISLAQVLLSPRAEGMAKLLSRSGFRHLVDLQYLVADRRLFPQKAPETPLQFEPAAGEQPDRLCRLVEQTYQGTRDCPAINDMRAMPDVLAGYRAAGCYDPQRWFFVRHKHQDVGVLLLTQHSPGNNWELVYMGITPAARGNGFGGHIAQVALWKAGQGGAEQLVLAVDEANEPALAMYGRAGFTAWNHRRVFARWKKDTGFPS